MFTRVCPFIPQNFSGESNIITLIISFSKRETVCHHFSRKRLRLNLSGLFGWNPQALALKNSQRWPEDHSGGFAFILETGGLFSTFVMADTGPHRDPNGTHAQNLNLFSWGKDFCLLMSTQRRMGKPTRSRVDNPFRGPHAFFGPKSGALGFSHPWPCQLSTKPTAELWVR